MISNLQLIVCRPDLFTVIVQGGAGNYEFAATFAHRPEGRTTYIFTAAAADLDDGDARILASGIVTTADFHALLRLHLGRWSLDGVARAVDTIPIMEAIDRIVDRVATTYHL